jgi:outer membrane immunogenic protein
MKAKRAALRAFLLAPLLFVATAGHGADLPRRSAPPPMDDYAPPPPILTWGGFYAGVQGGYGFSSFQDAGGVLVGSPGGGLIGVTGGYNYMVAPQILIGGEIDFAFAGIDKSRSPFIGAASRGEVDDVLTIRGRAGYALDRMLVYGTFGFAASKNTIGFLNGVPQPFFGQQSIFQTGWAVGGGAEYLITQRLSAKAEYIFASTGSDRYFEFSPYSLNSGVNMSTIKGGLNFHF